MDRKKVLLIGGSGHFGRLLIEDLRRHTACDLDIPAHRKVDLWSPASVAGALRDVTVAICAAGPFQKLPLTLAEQCIERGVHYIDFADDRSFVRGVRALAAAKSGSVPAICSAWSTASALSGCLVRIAAAQLTAIEAIYVSMAPGNRGARGSGTIASLLHSVGQPVEIHRDGRWQSVRGWTDSRTLVFPAPIGPRSGYIVDVPDHEIFPELFHARTVEFRAASELRILNAAVSSLGWFVRLGIIQNWTIWSRTLSRFAASAAWLGHDWGAVGVEVVGWREGRNTTRRAFVVADSGGQRIAVMPAAVMTSMLLSGAVYSGVVSHADWLTRDALEAECAKRGFRLFVEES